MLAYIYILVGLLFLSVLVESPSANEQKTLQSYAYSLTADMNYYHAEAEITCLNNINNKSTCPSGVISGLPSRNGATNILQYGNTIKSWTDGSTYIATTVCGQYVGKANMDEIYGWMRERFIKTTNNNYYLGHWNGSMVVMDMSTGGSSGLSLSQSSYSLSYNPCGTLYMNQPILYTKIY